MINATANGFTLEGPQDDLEAMKRIVESKTCANIRYRGQKKAVLVDIFSAGMVLALMSAMNKDLPKFGSKIEIFLALPIQQKTRIAVNVMVKG